MSETAIFIIGAIIFAVTIYGSVVAGGLALTKGSLIENDQYRRRVKDDQVGPGLPTDAKF